MPRNRGWYRVYDRMIDSPQVMELSDTEFRLLVSCWCIASANEGRIPYSARLVARRANLAGTVRDVEVMIERLVSLDLLEEDGDGFRPCRWAEHQYDKRSDRPEAVAQRVAKHRAGNANGTPGGGNSNAPVTPLKRECNADVSRMYRGENALDSDSDSDIDTESDDDSPLPPTEPTAPATPTASSSSPVPDNSPAPIPHADDCQAADDAEAVRVAVAAMVAAGEDRAEVEVIVAQARGNGRQVSNWRSYLASAMRRQHAEQAAGTVAGARASPAPRMSYEAEISAAAVRAAMARPEASGHA